MTDRFQDLIAITFEETFMDDILLTTNSAALQEKSDLDGYIDVLISRTIENEHSDSDLERWWSSFADSAMFMDTIICRNMNQKRFKCSVTQFVKSAVHDQA